VADRWQRAARERREPSADPVDDGQSADADRRALLAGLVAELPAEQQRVVRERFVEGRSAREIARGLGRTEGAVKQLQFRALQRLRARMIEMTPTAQTTRSGVREVIPYLAVRPALELLEFVERAFGAQSSAPRAGPGACTPRCGSATRG